MGALRILLIFKIKIVELDLDLNLNPMLWHRLCLPSRNGVNLQMGKDFYCGDLKFKP